MKHRKHQKTTYQTLADAIDSRMALDFNYADIAPLVQIDQQRAPKRAHTHLAAISGSSIPRFPRLRPAVAVLAVAVLLLGGAVGTTGWMIAHFSDRPLPPPVDATDSGTREDSREEPTAPAEPGGEPDNPVASEDDTLRWGGVVYIRTHIVVGEDRIDSRLGTVRPAGEEPTQETEIETEGCSWGNEKAFASCIEGGTAFFSISGCASNRYVAVPAPDGQGYVLYMTVDSAVPDGLGTTQVPTNEQ